MIVSIWFRNLAELSAVNGSPLEPQLISVLPDISTTTRDEAVWAVFRTTDAVVRGWAETRLPKPTIRGL